MELHDSFSKERLSTNLKAVFQLRVFHAYVDARKSLNQFQSLKMNKGTHGENSAFVRVFSHSVCQIQTT